MKKVIFLMILGLGLSISFVNAQFLGYSKHEVERYIMLRSDYKLLDQELSILGDSKVFYSTPIGTIIIYYDDNICYRFMDVDSSSSERSYISNLNRNSNLRLIGYDTWQCRDEFNIKKVRLDNTVGFIYTLL